MITGGQSYVSAPPAFSADGRLLLVCSGRAVSVFSTATAMLVSAAPRPPRLPPLDESVVGRLWPVPHRARVVFVSQVSELEGHEGDVTAVVVVPPPAAAKATPAVKLANYCWTAGLDGVLIYWDFVAAEVVRRVQVGLPVHSMVRSSCCLLPQFRCSGCYW